MEKIISQLRNPLLHQLSHSRAEAPVTHQKTATGPVNKLQPTAELSLPPALRQLFALQQTPAALQSELAQLSGRTSGNQLLSLMLQQLTLPAEKLAQPQQLRQLISDWFATQPVNSLTQPPASSSSNWLQSLSPALLLTLFARLPQQTSSSPLKQLARSTMSALGANATAGGSASLLNQLVGTLSHIRLSQIHLADTGAAQEPEYYLILPYQSEQSPRNVELLLRKRAQRNNEPEQAPFWLFSLRLVAGKAGPILIKGRWESSQTQLRFYTDSEASCRWMRRSLPKLESRLSDHGLGALETEVHVGRVPETLAPQPAELRKGL